MLNNIISFFTGIFVTATSLFVATPTTTPIIIPTPTLSAPSGYYIAEKTIQEQGKEVTIRMELNRNNNVNTITGTITGDCKGTITGILSKPREPLVDYLVSGSTNGTCLFVVPASATFDGQLRLWGGTSNIVILHVTANIFDSILKKDVILPITNL
jgi:hypothetical protein